MEIRASRIVLEDAAGNDRIVLELEHGQPRIKLLGKNGSVQVKLEIVSAWDNSAHLLLASPDGTTIGRFIAYGDQSAAGSASLLLGGGDKRIVASTNNPGMGPSLVMMDEAGNETAQLPAKPPSQARKASTKVVRKKAKHVPLRAAKKRKGAATK